MPTQEQMDELAKKGTIRPETAQDFSRWGSATMAPDELVVDAAPEPKEPPKPTRTTKGPIALTEEAGQAQQDAIIKQGYLGQQAQGQMADVLSQAEVDYEAKSIEQEIEQEREQKALSKQLQTAEEAEKRKLYFNGSPDQVAAAEQMLQSNDPKVRDRGHALLNRYKTTDSGKIYGDSTWRKVLAGISIGLGAFGSSVKGTKNPALEIINQAADAEVNKQMEGRSALGELAKEQRGLYDDMYGVYQDKEEARLASKNAILEGAERKVRIIGEQAKGSMMAAKAEEQAAALRAEIEKNKEALRVSQANRHRNAFEMNLKKVAASREPQREMLKDATEEKFTNAQTLLQMLDELESAKGDETQLENVFLKYVPDSEAKDYESLRKLFTAQLRKNLSGAAFTEAEAKDYLSMVPESSSFAGTAAGKFRALRGMIERDFQNRVSNYGRRRDVSAYEEYLASRDKARAQAQPSEVDEVAKRLGLVAR